MKTKLRLCDEVVLENFKNMRVVQENGDSNLVPILWGTDERAKSWAFKPLLNDPLAKMMLPFLNIHNYKITKLKSGLSDIRVDYKLNAWTLYMEDSYQLLEQVMSKFSPQLKLWNLEGNRQIGNLDLNEITNNVGSEERVVKYSFDLSAFFFKELMGDDDIKSTFKLNKRDFPAYAVEAISKCPIESDGFSSRLFRKCNVYIKEEDAVTRFDPESFDISDVYGNCELAQPVINGGMRDIVISKFEFEKNRRSLESETDLQMSKLRSSNEKL